MRRKNGGFGVILASLGISILMGCGKEQTEIVAPSWHGTIKVYADCENGGMVHGEIDDVYSPQTVTVDWTPAKDVAADAGETVTISAYFTWSDSDETDSDSGSATVPENCDSGDTTIPDSDTTSPDTTVVEVTTTTSDPTPTSTDETVPDSTLPAVPDTTTATTGPSPQPVDTTAETTVPEPEPVVVSVQLTFCDVNPAECEGGLPNPTDGSPQVDLG